MKLRNKKTGEIGCLSTSGGSMYIVLNDNGVSLGGYNSLGKLNAEWEDYEEPKVAYFIDSQGRVCKFSDTDVDDWTQEEQIGNKFKTEEETEEAVEKLKAFKRLRDKGFRFDGYDSGHNSNKELCGQAYFKAGNFWFDIKQDLDLLFGGEE